MNGELNGGGCMLVDIDMSELIGSLNEEVAGIL